MHVSFNNNPSWCFVFSYYFFIYYFLNITLAFLWKLYTWFCFCPQCHGCIELRWVKIWHVHPNCYGLTDDMTCDDGESSYVWWLFQLRKKLKIFPFTVHFEKNLNLNATIICMVTISTFTSVRPSTICLFAIVSVTLSSFQFLK